MALRVREPTDADWVAIHAVANEAVLDAPDGNSTWLQARRGFDEGARKRRHYVAEDGDGRIVAYGAVEQGGDAGRYRLFLVMRPDRLEDGTGDALFDALLRDLGSLGAEIAWMREQADDQVLLFALARGFSETGRYVLGADQGVYAGLEVVEIARALSH